MENQNPQISRRTRQHYSGEEKQRHVQDQASSGLTAAAYCRQHGLRYGNFLNWQKSSAKVAPSLRPMELIAGAARQESVAELRLAGGQILLVHSGCSEKMAVALIKALS